MKGTQDPERVMEILVAEEGIVHVSACLADNFTDNVKHIREYLEYLKQPNIAAANPLAGTDSEVSKTSVPNRGTS